MALQVNPQIVKNAMKYLAWMPESLKKEMSGSMEASGHSFDKAINEYPVQALSAAISRSPMMPSAQIKWKIRIMVDLRLDYTESWGESLDCIWRKYPKLRSRDGRGSLTTEGANIYPHNTKYLASKGNGWYSGDWLRVSHPRPQVGQFGGFELTRELFFYSKDINYPFINWNIDNPLEKGGKS